MSRSRGSRRIVGTIAVMLLSVSGCTVASPDPADYRERTELAVGDAISHLATTEKVLRAAEEDKVLGTYALTTVRASDAMLETAVGAYAELYPPEQLDALAGRVDRLLGDASDLVGDSRIALHRGRRAEYPALIEDLESLLEEMEEFEGRLS